MIKGATCKCKPVKEVTVEQALQGLRLIAACIFYSPTKKAMPASAISLSRPCLRAMSQRKAGGRPGLRINDDSRHISVDNVG